VRLAFGLGILLWGVMLHADTIAAFKAGINTEVAWAKTLHEHLKAGSRVDCPGVATADLSPCFKAAVQHHEIATSAVISELLNAGQTAALADRRRGYDNNTGFLLLADNEMTVFERIHVDRLLLHRQPTGTLVYYAELVMLRQNEEKMLAQSLTAFRRDFEFRLIQLGDNLKQGRHPSSTEHWQTQTISTVRGRLAKMNDNVLRFPASETQINSSQVLKLSKSERTYALCTQPAIRNCRSFSEVQCYKLADRLFSQCAALKRPPSSFVDPESADIYNKGLLTCVASKWKIEFSQMAKSCP
jgi:hypothetical protein